MKQEAIYYLKKYWGHDSFRGSQEKIVEKVLNNKDVLALLPTGGGKSVCYQIPALMKPGVCIVVSPLIALIHDQVNALKEKGIKSIALTGGIKTDELVKLLDNCIYGNYKFLYLSPERLQQQLVQERIGEMNVNLIAIDEAHCISQWGNDFRPAYLQCSVLRDLQPEVPIIALTATATTKVARDITENLRFRDFAVFKDSFLRSNISYQVIWEEDKRFRLRDICANSPSSGIVYVRSRRLAEELATMLQKHKIEADYFHGGIPGEDKKRKLKNWLNNRSKIMVATNAFGMGVDKPDVSVVVHYQIPDSIEHYFQEAGRAGRDGSPAQAILITNKNDETQLKNQFLSVLPDVDFVKMLYKKLNSYFQIPYGGGANEQYPFRFNTFCDHYYLNHSLSYNALQLLDQNSVISLSQEFSRRTTVQFIASKNLLFRYLEKMQSLAPLVQVILRTYGGIFDFETKINTLLLAKKASTPEKNIIQCLEKLSNDGIITYEAEERDLQLVFLVPREDDLTINVFSEKIKANKENKIQNIRAILAYVANRKMCRSRQLLRYFGEKSSKNCNTCDVCINRADLVYSEEEVEEQILDALAKNGCNSRSLIAHLPYEENSILKHLKLLLEDGKISIDHKNEYHLNT